MGQLSVFLLRPASFLLNISIPFSRPLPVPENVDISWTNRSQLSGMILHFMPGVTFAPDLQPGKVNMRETENKTIVVIDDNEDFRNFTGTILRFEGFEVIEASNGREGMARIRNTMPDLILCDIEMADMNGIELYKGLRKDKVLRKIPFVFITAAQVENTYIRELATLDHFEILKKPFGLQELLDCTHRHLGVEHSIRLN